MGTILGPFLGAILGAILGTILGAILGTILGTSLGGHLTFRLCVGRGPERHLEFKPQFARRIVSEEGVDLFGA